VRTRQESEDQAVAIATALGIFAGILAAVGLVAWGIQTVTHGLDGHGDVIAWTAVLLAGVVACAHLATDRR